MNYEGILLINKPRGISSFDVIRVIREKTNTKKIGHAGTLDPEAEGLVIVCIGRNATKHVSVFMKQTKKYLCNVIFGIKTTSGDRDGLIIDYKKDKIDEKDLLKIIEKYKGKISQKPPMFSAIHHQGKRLYELAREGKVVDIKPRDIFIHDIKLNSFIMEEYSKAELEITCSSGTYVRTLVEDIGNDLGSCAFISRLVRISSGYFELKQSHDLFDLKENQIKDKIINIQEALNEIKNP